jgi:Rrf2 family protein
LTVAVPRRYTPVRLFDQDKEANVRGPGANAKTQYAVQAVIHLALQERHQVVSVSGMAVALSISPKLLEDVLGALRTAGIVQSRRGKDGGYTLALAPAELSVLDVVRAVEGPDGAAGREAEGALAQVSAQAFETALAAAIKELAGRSIEQLAEEARRLEAERTAPYMYHL